MVVRAMFLIFIVGLLNINVVCASSATPQDMIKVINDQLATVDNPKEKAKLYCFRARNYTEAGKHGKAKDDYLRAIDASYEGWIINELGQFMYKTGEFEKAYNLADRLLADFPQFEKEAIKLKKQARAKWEEEYLKANPPTITLDTAPDPNRITRHDLIRQTESKQYQKSGSKSYETSTYKTYKNSPATRKSSGSGGSHIKGFGVGSEFRQNYKKSQQGQ